MSEISDFLPGKECEHCSLCGLCRQENNGHDWSCADEGKSPILREQIFIQGRELCGESVSNPDCIYIKDAGLLAIEIKDRQIEYVEKDDKKRLKNQLLSVCSASDRAGLKLKAFVLLVSSIKNSKHSDLKLFKACKEMFESIGITIDKNNMMRDSKHRGRKYTTFKVVKCKDLKEDLLTSLFVE